MTPTDLLAIEHRYDDLDAQYGEFFNGRAVRQLEADIEALITEIRNHARWAKGDTRRTFRCECGEGRARMTTRLWRNVRLVCACGTKLEER